MLSFYLFLYVISLYIYCITFLSSDSLVCVKFTTIRFHICFSNRPCLLSSLTTKPLVPTPFVLVDWKTQTVLSSTYIASERKKYRRKKKRKQIARNALRVNMTMTPRQQQMYSKQSNAMHQDGNHMNMPPYTSGDQSDTNSDDDLAWCLARIGGTQEEINIVIQLLFKFRLYYYKIEKRKSFKEKNGPNGVGKDDEDEEEEIDIDDVEKDLVLRRPLCAKEFAKYLYMAKHQRKSSSK